MLRMQKETRLYYLSVTVSTRTMCMLVV